MQVAVGEEAGRVAVLLAVAAGEVNVLHDGLVGAAEDAGPADVVFVVEDGRELAVDIAEARDGVGVVVEGTPELARVGGGVREITGRAHVDARLGGVICVGAGRARGVAEACLTVCVGVFAYTRTLSSVWVAERTCRTSC